MALLVDSTCALIVPFLDIEVMDVVVVGVTIFGKQN